MVKQQIWIDVGVIAAMAVVLLIPTLINGFPLVDYDSMSYLSAAHDVVIPENRPIFYSVFTLAVGWAISPWPVAIVQAIIVATGIWHLARVFFGVTDWPVLLAIAVVLTAASSLPWYVGYMTPDLFTSLLIGALMVVGLAWDRLSRLARVSYFLVIATCISFHYSNVPIALGANLVLGVLALLGWRTTGAARPRFIAINGAIALGVAALVGATTYDHGKLAMSPSSSTFYLARLLDDGSALRVMNRDCATTHWHVCDELADLNAYVAAKRSHPGEYIYRMSLADHFLWGGGLQRLGDFDAVEPEAGKVIAAAWAAYPGEQVGATVRNAVSQASSFWYGDFLHSWGVREPLPTIQRIFGDDDARAYMSSMQQRNALRFGLPNMAGFALLAASFAFLVYQSAVTFKRDRFWTYMSAALMFFLLGNAFVTGVISGVFANYQARVIWLLPLFALLSAAHFYWKPQR